MADVQIAEGQTIDERMLPALPRVSWGAIFGGAFAALGLWLLLYAFGLAVGLSGVDPNNPGSIKGSGIFTGVWGVFAPLVALFVGGVVAGRLAGIFNRGYGAIHGLVMWGVATVAGACLAIVLISSIVSGAASMGRAAVQAGGTALRGVAGGASASGAADMASQLGVDWNDVMAPVNQRLRAEGKPALTAAQLQAAAQDSLQTAVRTGTFDRSLVERSLAQNTSLSRADVQDVSRRMETQVNNLTGQLKSSAQSVAQTAQTGALKAADATGKAFWGVFGALALGLVAALVGGAVGIPKIGGINRPEPRPRQATVESPPRAPVGPPREAYPRG
jgi:hypothetical protein